MAKLLEIAVDSLASAREAVAGGAQRLELCAALSVGGLTPYRELLEQIRRESDIPVRCLMRPRGGDFLYTREEVEMMVRQIRDLRDRGADGFVIGCLTPQGELDRGAMEPLVEAARGAGLTLHRCIDVSRDPAATWQGAKELGMDTVLTSGAAGSCLEGMETIGALLELERTLGGPRVLIGAGVKAAVITAFRRRFPQAQAFHMSGKEDRESAMVFRREGVPMGLPGLDEWRVPVTSREAVRAARAALEEKLA